MRFSLATAMSLGLLAMAGTSQAGIREYYIGVDGLGTFTSGTYNGKANPNAGRLTFLYAHPNEASPSGNHYHGIGAYSLTGPAGSPTVQPTNGNNKLPEVSTGQLPLSLRPGSGAYAGAWRTGLDSGEHYADLLLQGTGALNGFAAGTPEHYMFNSSAGRWSGSIAGAVPTLEIVSLSPGLKVGTEGSTLGLASAGQQIVLDPDGDGSFALGLVLYTDLDPASLSSPLTATFKLTDERAGGTALGDSGTFSVLVPEPAAVALLGLGGLSFLRRRRR